MFAVLVPLKRPERAKTRLAQSGVAEHQRLAVAFAWDTIEAAAASPMVAGIWVVTDAPDLIPDGAVHLVDQGEGDLNLALSRAAAVLRDAQPEVGIAALCGDLPALVADDLSEALTLCDRRSFVVDAAGTGTTLLVAPAGCELAPAFGVNSAKAHAASGASALTGALATLRMDVDTSVDLEHAVAIGVGPNTLRVLQQITDPGES